MMRSFVIAALIVAAVSFIPATILALLNRRPDVTFRAACLAGSDLAARPERYVKQEWVQVLKIMNFMGAISFMSAGVALAVWSALRFWHSPI